MPKSLNQSDPEKMCPVPIPSHRGAVVFLFFSSGPDCLRVDANWAKASCPSTGRTQDFSTQKTTVGWIEIEGFFNAHSHTWRIIPVRVVNPSNHPILFIGFGTMIFTLHFGGVLGGSSQDL